VQVFGHEVGSGLGEWWASGVGEERQLRGHPSAAGLPTGEVLVASSRELEAGTVVVQRFPGPNREPTTEVELHGYTQPTLAADSGEAWLVAVRASDGSVVSRSAPPGQSWTETDRVEIQADAGGGLAWPSALADGGSRHLVARGPSSIPHRSSVLGLDRAA
jgi:hypothetical protein